MQTVQIFTGEWYFQLVGVMIDFSGFCFMLCMIEVSVCVYAEVRGEHTDLPTQRDIHRLFLWFKRRKRWKQCLKNGVSNMF